MSRKPQRRKNLSTLCNRRIGGIFDAGTYLVFTDKKGRILFTASKLFDKDGSRFVNDVPQAGINLTKE